MEICSKKEQKHKRKRGERERERTKRREEKVRGTAQESFSHEAQKNKNNASHHIYSKDNRGDGQPPLLSQRTKNKTIIHRFKEVTPPGHGRDSNMHKLYTWHPKRSI